MENGCLIRFSREGYDNKLNLSDNMIQGFVIFVKNGKVKQNVKVKVNLAIRCSPNSRFMTETMVSSSFRWLYNNLEYPRFICFLYSLCVLDIGTCSYRAGITVNACKVSLTN
jgi:hypothetical protein